MLGLVHQYESPVRTVACLPLTLLLLLLSLAAPLRAAPSLGEAIAALLVEERLDGAVWATLDGEGAVGVSHAGRRTPMRADSRVHVGSIAKTVLAAGVLRLISQGRLDLDAPVAPLLPALDFDNPWQAQDPVRVRHLLDHTAGLDDARLWQIFSGKADPDAPLAAAFPPGRGVLRVRTRPGARTSYSNMSYTLLGMVIEATVGQRYERYLDRALLAPLGMRDSTFTFVSQDRDQRLAMGHFEDGVAHAAMPSYLRPAGQFTTTAADMARFARFLMGDGTLAGQSFIAPALLRRMGQGAGQEAARAGLQVGYGLGLRTVDRHGAVARCHGGNGIGFRAMLCLFPERRQAFFLAINTDSETADYQRFDALLTQALVPAVPSPVPRPVPVPRFDSGPWLGFYLPAPNRFDTLRLVDSAFSFARLQGNGGDLVFRPFQGAEIELVHEGGGLFRTQGKLLASHALLTSSDGRRIVTNGTQSYAQVPSGVLVLLWSSLGAGVLGLVTIALRAGGRLARRRFAVSDPLALPLAGMLALLLPLPFFYAQSLVRLGDLTVASALLAVVTALLPVAMAVGLARSLRRKAGMDAAASLAVLQGCVVLATGGLLPLQLWR